MPESRRSLSPRHHLCPCWPCLILDYRRFVAAFSVATDIRYRIGLMPLGTSDQTVAHIVVEKAQLGRRDVEVLSLTGKAHRLVDCVMEEIDASRLTFKGWVFSSCNVKHADFTGANLEASVWSSCKGGQADFTACDLSESRIENCDFNNASFVGAKLNETVFQGLQTDGGQSV